MIYVIDLQRFRSHRLYRRGIGWDELVVREMTRDAVGRALYKAPSWVDLINPNVATSLRWSARVYFDGAPFGALPLERLGRDDVVYVGGVSPSGNVTWYGVSCRAAL